MYVMENFMYALNSHKITSQSVLKCSNYFPQQFLLPDFSMYPLCIKKKCLKLLKVRITQKQIYMNVTLPALLPMDTTGKKSLEV